jgi:hypothetical protein
VLGGGDLKLVVKVSEGIGLAWSQLAGKNAQDARYTAFYESYLNCEMMAELAQAWKNGSLKAGVCRVFTICNSDFEAGKYLPDLKVENPSTSLSPLEQVSGYDKDVDWLTEVVDLNSQRHFSCASAGEK